MKNIGNNIVDFYIEIIEEDHSEVKKKLEEANIETSELKNRISKMIQKRRGELSLEKGKAFKSAYNSLKETSEQIYENEVDDFKMAVGFRNADKETKHAAHIPEVDLKKLSDIDKARREVFGGS